MAHVNSMTNIQCDLPIWRQCKFCAACIIAACVACIGAGKFMKTLVIRVVRNSPLGHPAAVIVIEVMISLYKNFVRT